ncbi:hypothetical protein H0H93_013256, partial [Arthromyces matolae]
MPSGSVDVNPRRDLQVSVRREVSSYSASSASPTTPSQVRDDGNAILQAADENENLLPYLDTDLPDTLSPFYTDAHLKLREESLALREMWVWQKEEALMKLDDQKKVLIRQKEESIGTDTDDTLVVANNTTPKGRKSTEMELFLQRKEWMKEREGMMKRMKTREKWMIEIQKSVNQREEWMRQKEESVMRRQFLINTLEASWKERQDKLKTEEILMKKREAVVEGNDASIKQRESIMAKKEVSMEKREASMKEKEASTN